MAKKKPLFKIIDIVKGKGDGHMYCTTEPEHPSCHKRKDRNKCYIYLHQVLVENSIGKLIRKDQEVHHKDGNPANNALSNLELVTHAGHAKDHAKKKKFWKKSPRNKPGRKAALRVIESYWARLSQ